MGCSSACCSAGSHSAAVASSATRCQCGGASASLPVRQPRPSAGAARSPWPRGLAPASVTGPGSAAPRHTTRPPARVPVPASARINPGAVVRDRRGLQLIQQRQFQAVGQVPCPSSLPEELLDHAARNDHHDDRLQFPAACGRTWMLQTIWVTGMGDSFSSCNSTIERVSSKLLAGAG